MLLRSGQSFPGPACSSFANVRLMDGGAQQTRTREPLPSPGTKPAFATPVFDGRSWHEVDIWRFAAIRIAVRSIGASACQVTGRCSGLWSKTIKSSMIARIQKALEASWSLESSTLWTEGNPASGQCGVTALVAQDFLGGEILKTPYRDIWHFYNRIDGEVVDFTKSQFVEPVEYVDRIATRDEAFADTNEQQYRYLSAAVKRNLKAD